MKFLAKNLRLILSSLAVIALLIGCTQHPDEEQIQKLEETKSAALSAEKKLSEKKKERSDLEAQLEAKKAELAKVKAEKERVKQKLEARNAETQN